MPEQDFEIDWDELRAKAMDVIPPFLDRWHNGVDYKENNDVRCITHQLIDKLWVSVGQTEQGYTASWQRPPIRLAALLLTVVYWDSLRGGVGELSRDAGTCMGSAFGKAIPVTAYIVAMHHTLGTNKRLHSRRVDLASLILGYAYYYDIDLPVAIDEAIDYLKRATNRPVAVSVLGKKYEDCDAKHSAADADS